MLAYWPETANPDAVQVIDSPAASVVSGQVTVTPWSSATVMSVRVTLTTLVETPQTCSLKFPTS
jgi:hypothetical protein